MSVHALGSDVAAAVDEATVSAYRAPTDFPESDGTFEWRHTTLVLVEVTAGDRRGTGWTYADTATARLARHLLVEVVQGRNAMAIPETWSAMVHAIRNLGRPGIASMAISAIDTALWDLKARLLELPLVTLLGAARPRVPVYGSGGFTSYSVDQLRRQLRDWVADGIPRVKMKVGRDPARDVERVWAACEAIGDAFFPDTARAAVEVLEAAGCRVSVPRKPLCCGRPLYDYGMLNLAKRMLQRTLDALRDDIRAGVPVVGLEPSCVAVFRDEMPGLLPHDTDARRLREQTFTLAEFLMSAATDYRPPRLARRALVHGHCHHKAVLGFDPDQRMLEKLGVDAEVVDAGCCGMAGSFGFEAGHFDVSMAIGERALLPAVRAAATDTLIVADGFSCREQIAQATPRGALHLADVARLALATAEERDIFRRTRAA